MKRISALLICLLVSVSMFARQYNEREVDGTSGATQKSDSIKKSDPDFSKFRFGGYGEMLARFYGYGPNRYSGSGLGSPKEHRSDISIPRFVLAFDYKFSPSWVLGAEIEFEYGGTGSGIEAEYGEGVEYEYEFEKGGEVALEQFHITKIFNKAFQVRAGHIIVPVGITNAHHEPVNFMGTVRPEGESTIIPCTWHETGLSVLGSFAGFNYEAMIVNGLDPYGFSSENWIQKGRQAKFEVPIFTNPAFAARVEYEGLLDGLRLGASGYYANSTAKNTDSRATTATYFADGGGVKIISADGQYKNHGLQIRANYLFGWVDDALAINQLRVNKYTGYPSTPVSTTAIDYFVEAGYDIGQLCGNKFSLSPFVRYQHYNSMNDDDLSRSPVQLDWYNINLITAGINYNPLPNLVIKADYTHRMVGTDDNSFNNENLFSVGVAFVGWFVSK